jgi:hypothetical protein
VEISKKLISPRRLLCSATVLASLGLAACGPVTSSGNAAGAAPGSTASTAPASSTPASPASSSPSVASSATTASAKPTKSRSPSPSASKTVTSTPTSSSTSAAPSGSSSSGSGSASPSAGSSGGTGASGSGAACVTSAAKGSCGPYSDSAVSQTAGTVTTVGQDVWNAISGWQQTLHATSPSNWYTTANMPKGNTAVVSFPNVGTTYSEPALSSFSSVTSSFTEDMHANSATSAWAAFDIWLNKWGNEVMIQHDFANNGACPAKATAQFGGSNGVPVQSWELCQYGTELIWKLTGGSEQSGSVDVLAMLQWLESHGYLPASSTLTDISYGWEICSTGGTPETFNLSRYTVTAVQK